jgi:hypothetical protein
VRGVSSKDKNLPELSSRVALSNCDSCQYLPEDLCLYRHLITYLADHAIDSDIHRCDHIFGYSKCVLSFTAVLRLDATVALVSTRSVRDR